MVYEAELQTCKTKYTNDNNYLPCRCGLFSGAEANRVVSGAEANCVFFCDVCDIIYTMLLLCFCLCVDVCVWFFGLVPAIRFLLSLLS